jgi:SOS-response transcriptional repressor LexA
MTSMTARQEVVFEVIRESIRERGFSPTIREIAKETNIASPNGVMRHVRALEKKGVIARARNAIRGITVLRWGYLKTGDRSKPLRGNSDTSGFSQPCVGR